MANVSEPAGADPQGMPEEFWAELERRVDARNDAAFERWLAKLDEEGKLDDAPPTGDGRGAAPAGGGVPARRATDKPASPRDPKASGGSFFDTLSRVALGTPAAKPKS